MIDGSTQTATQLASSKASAATAAAADGACEVIVFFFHPSEKPLACEIVNFHRNGKASLFARFIRLAS